MHMWAVLIALLIGAVAADNSTQDDTLIVTSVVFEPYIKEQGGAYEGFIVDILSEVMTSLNRKFEIRIVPDGKYGQQDPETGDWNGMVGEVMNGNADIIAAPFTLTAKREEILDFTKPFLHTGLLAMMSKPLPEIRPDFFLIFRPFSTGVWFLILVCFLVFSLLLFVINQFHPSEWRQAFSRGKGTEDNVKAFGFQGSLWIAFSTLSLQGYHKTPRSLAGRILMAFWFFFVIFTIVLYISSMVTTLRAANQEPTVPNLPKDLDTLMENGGKVVVIAGGQSENFFKTSSVPLYEQVAQNLIALSSFEEGLKTIRNGEGQFAMVTDSPTVQYAISRECDLKTIGNMLNSAAFAFAVAKGSDLRDEINDVILALRENGELHRLQKKWWNDKKECESPSVDEDVPASPVERIVARPVLLAHFSGGIIIFMVGILISSLVAVGEFAYRNQKKMPRKNKEQLLEAEEGQALNETSKTMLDKTNVEEENEKEMKEMKKKEDDTGPELEPEDKEEKEEKTDAAENKPEEDSGDKIEELKS